MNPQVSVIMPNYNKGEHLRWAIKSVLEQTVDEIELVVVDDASTDGSLAIIKEFQEKDSRVLLLENAANLGPAASINIGLRASTAGVVTFLGSDDLFSKDRIERQLRIINSNEKEVVVYSDPISLGINSSSMDSVVTRYSFRPSGWIFPHLIAGRFSFHGAVTAVARRCLEFVGLFDESLRWGEDLEMCLRLAKWYEFVYDPVATYGYRTHEGNTIQRMSRPNRYWYQSRIIERHLLSNLMDLDSQTRKTAFNLLLSCYVASRQWNMIIKNGLLNRVGLTSLVTLPFRAVTSDLLSR